MGGGARGRRARGRAGCTLTIHTPLPVGKRRVLLLYFSSDQFPPSLGAVQSLSSTKTPDMPFSPHSSRASPRAESCGSPSVERAPPRHARGQQGCGDLRSASPAWPAALPTDRFAAELAKELNWKLSPGPHQHK